MEITVDPVLIADAADPDRPFQRGVYSGGGIYVDGEAVNSSIFNAEVKGGSVWDESTQSWIEPIANLFDGNYYGNVVLTITPNGNTANIEGARTEAHVAIVQHLVDNYYYDDEPVAAGAVLRFEAGDAAFDPAKISAAASDGAEDLDIDVTVYDADGEELPADYDYTQIGTYTVKATVRSTSPPTSSAARAPSPSRSWASASTPCRRSTPPSTARPPRRPWSSTTPRPSCRTSS